MIDKAKVEQAEKSVRAVMQIAAALADAIRELGTVPAGELYANSLMGMGVSAEDFNRLIDVMVQAKMVKRDSHHLLTWIGPKKETATKQWEDGRVR